MFTLLRHQFPAVAHVLTHLAILAFEPKSGFQYNLQARAGFELVISGSGRAWVLKWDPFTYCWLWYAQLRSIQHQLFHPCNAISFFSEKVTSLKQQWARSLFHTTVFIGLSRCLRSLFKTCRILKHLLFVFRKKLIEYCVHDIRVAESEVKYPTPTPIPTFPEFPTPTP